MSHTTTLKGIQIKDALAIERAVADLQREGVSIELRKNAKPRMFYEAQADEVGICEYVLRLPKSRYDVGLKFNKETKQFDAFLDTWAGDITGQIGAACPLPRDEADRQGEHAIGRFTQRYGVHAAKIAAAAQGYMVTESVDASGTVHLTVDM